MGKLCALCLCQGPRIIDPQVGDLAKNRKRELAFLAGQKFALFLHPVRAAGTDQNREQALVHNPGLQHCFKSLSKLVFLLVIPGDPFFKVVLGDSGPELWLKIDVRIAGLVEHEV